MPDNPLQRSISIKKDQAWVFECIDKIVATKQAAGIRSSFSYELTRLAGNQLANEMKGSELDRRILKGI